jgi:HEAT repeats
MNYSRTLTPVCSLLATALLALAQTPPPRAATAPMPPDAWEQTPAPAPRPAVAPRAATAPMPPMPPDAWEQTPVAPMAPLPAMPPMEPLAPMPAVAPMPLDMGDLDLQMSLAKELTLEFNPDLQDKIDAAMEQVGRMKFDLQDGTFAKEEMFAAKDMAMAAQRLKFAFAPQGIGISGGVSGGVRAPMPPIPPMPAKSGNGYRGMSEDRLYSAGQNSLDNRQWDQGLEYFNQVISRSASRVDGALFWKAYALGKLGRRDEGAAAIAELRKSFAGSRWLDDAKALELELKQASGQNVSPEAESDDELKLMAINGLMQSDPERAIPLLETQLKGAASPKVKRNTLFVLAQSNSPKAQALVEQIARGGANPDLQLKAISYMNERRKPNNAQVLSEIYAATNDTAVKRAILQAYNSMRDKDHLLQAAKSEKSPELREFAISALSNNNGTPELWQLYQAETTTEGKLQLLRYMHSNSNADKLLEVVRNEKDPKVRADAMRALASQRAGVSADAMVSLYSAEQDAQIKMSIVDGLYSQRNAKALVDIARAEKDTKMKLRIVERLSNMKSKEATDYLEEILKK